MYICICIGIEEVPQPDLNYVLFELICICMYVCVCVYNIYIYIYIYNKMCVCLCVCLCVFVFVCVCVCIGSEKVPQLRSLRAYVFSTSLYMHIYL